MGAGLSVRADRLVEEVERPVQRLVRRFACLLVGRSDEAVTHPHTKKGIKKRRATWATLPIIRVHLLNKIYHLGMRGVTPYFVFFVKFLRFYVK